ncbi:hypothetical protein F4780DRAFT_634093 [Xylariomycetidae sp. FL0641]|nr:hypothetical protein F4780DRAFT_634093 [Xylariomycetidae sp. FL0641]
MSHVMAQSPLESLPTEILLQTLSTFNTRALLPLAAVSRRFRGLVGRLHFYRLIEATALREHALLLECYHPTDKLSAPSLHCENLGTDGLTEAGVDARLETLNGLYTRFRPYLGEEDRRPRARRPTRAVLAGTEEPLVQVPSHDINLESGDPFSQLCTATNVVKVGRGRGLFLSIAPITDGVVRVWRDWLHEQAAKIAAGEATQQRQPPTNPGLDESILWVDSSKDVGLKFRIVEKVNDNAPVLIGSNEDPPVSFSLEYQELVIRTNRLLLSLEDCEARQVTHAGNAIVIASIS